MWSENRCWISSHLRKGSLMVNGVLTVRIRPLAHTDTCKQIHAFIHLYARIYVHGYVYIGAQTYIETHIQTQIKSLHIQTAHKQTTRAHPPPSPPKKKINKQNAPKQTQTAHTNKHKTHHQPLQSHNPRAIPPAREEVRPNIPE